jgi:hypothetical protein
LAFQSYRIPGPNFSGFHSLQAFSGSIMAGNDCKRQMKYYFYILLIKSKPYLGEKLISAQVISLQS